MTVIPIVMGAFGTVPKEIAQGLADMEIRGRVETIQNIQTITLIRSERILRRNLETWGD